MPISEKTRRIGGASGFADASPANASSDFKPAQKRASPPWRSGISEADGTAADAKTGDKNGGRRGAKWSLSCMAEVRSKREAGSKLAVWR